jgi:hypothetical protein
MGRARHENAKRRSARHTMESHSKCRPFEKDCPPARAAYRPRA